MITISKPKLLAILVTIIVASTSFYVGTVFSIPAPSINSVCEPGACSSLPCSWYVYLDTLNNQAASNVTLAKNCITGANDFKESNSGSLLTDIFNTIATASAPNPPPPGGVGAGAQYVIEFGVGDFYIPSTITINFPGGSSANAMIWRGQGEDKTAIILAKNVNGDMFDFAGLGDKFEIMDIKFFGNKTFETGTSTLLNFQATMGGGEFIWEHNEFRDCLTSCVIFQNVNQQWNAFIENWFLNSPIGIDYKSTHKDIRIVGNKFGASGTPAMAGIQIDSGNMASIVISGNIFDTANIVFSIGSTTNVAITGNVFNNAITKAIDYEGTGLGSLTNFNNVITGNEFSTGTGTNVAVYLARYVDGITVTGNQFSGYTSSATVPVTLIQTTQKLTTLVTQNSGMGSSWAGFGIAQPAVAASTVNVQNTNPYQVRVYITATGTGITAYKITDATGTANTFTTTVTVGYTIEVDPYAQVALTYSGTPTWLWYGEANLA